MISTTRKAILKGLKKWYKDNPQHNTKTIKKNNPFPVSPRWIDNIIAEEKKETGRAFDKGKTIAFMEHIGVPYRLDGGVIFSTNKTEENEATEI